MPAAANYLAIDLGASGGRAVLGSLNDGELSLREIHRFPNQPLQLDSGLHWDTTALFAEIKRAIGRAAAHGLAGLGIDTWGVDYGLVSASGELLAAPHHYRDPRTRGEMEHALKVFPRDRLYARTGIQFLPFNTVFQLLAEKRGSPERLARAATLLFMPDLFHYWLTGVRRTEHTIASTSQMYDPAAGRWASDVLQALQLPSRILPDIAEPGTPVGTLRPEVAQEAGTGPVTVIAPASHDTASAVAAVPASGEAWAYISSGTWSLVGRELASPITTPEAMAANFTNERGVAGTIRFHKNVAGLWLLQECQRLWAQQGRGQPFDVLSQSALSAPAFVALVDPDDTAFAEFGDMPARIRAWCERTGQAAPASDGALVRCILESLALKCRIVIDTLESLTAPVGEVHMVGGGVQNSLLCQFTANAMGRPVFAGPVEATAAGNALTQALAHGHVSSLREIRDVVRRSFAPTLYEPHEAASWDEALARYRTLIGT